MPIYEYTCGKCSDHFELLIGANDKPICPSCESDDVHKEFSVPAAHTQQGNQQLPMASPPGGNCGLPQCGQGRCMGME